MGKSIHEAGYAELMRAASQSGLDVTYGKTKLPEVRELLSRAFGDDFEIEAGDVRADPEQVVVAPAVPGTELSGDYRHDPKVTVNIASDELTGGKHPFPICVNGDQILVKRDTDVAIPFRHYDALRNAREGKMSQEFDAANMRYIEHNDEQYAVRFSVVDMPSRAEIEAYYARTADIGREPVKKAA